MILTGNHKVIKVKTKMSDFEKAKSYKADDKAGTPPSFKGDGVAAWVNHTKDERPYLTIQILGKNGMRVNAWKYEPREKEDESPLNISQELI